MRLQPTDLLGLAAGFALGAIGLAWLSLPDTGASPPPAAAPPKPVPPPAVVVPPPIAPPAPGAAAAGALPKVWTPPGRQATPEVVAMPSPVPLPPITALPNVIRPDHPGGRPGGVADTAGTGFFVTSDGMVLTAAHVVEGCRDLRLVSPFIPPTLAESLATDRTRDIAVLRARARGGMRPPATLALGPPRTAREPARFLGYPADGDPRIASAAAGETRNDAAPGLIGRGVDPAEQIWLRSDAVRPGFSGGPVIGRDGQAMGLVFGRLSFDRPNGGTVSVVVGPGAGALARFVRDNTGDVLPVAGGGNDDGAVHRAVVHVICRK